MSGVVVVTGAARGIGRAICERLREEDQTVVAVDIDEAALPVGVETLVRAGLDVLG